jgi:hypothetical protein
MGRHGVDRYITDSERRALVALAWHDVTCPEGPECPDRPAHAASQHASNTDALQRFMERLSELETEVALDEHQLV